MLACESLRTRCFMPTETGTAALYSVMQEPHGCSAIEWYSCPLITDFTNPQAFWASAAYIVNIRRELVAVGLMLWVVHLLRFINFLEGCDGPIEQYWEMQCVSGTLYVWIVARACVFHNRCIMLVWGQPHCGVCELWPTCHDMVSWGLCNVYAFSTENHASLEG